MDEEQILKDIDTLKKRAFTADTPQENAALRGQAAQLEMNLQIQAQLQEQAQNEKRKLQQEKELELERQQHDIAMEQVKYEHEKEMQLLKMLDDVSIPLVVYRKFEEKLFKSDNIKPEDTEQYSKLMTSATEMLNKKYEDGEKFKELLQSNMNYPNNEVKYTDKYKKFEDFINNKYSAIMLDMETKDFNIIDNNKEFIEVFISEKKGTQITKTIYSFIGPLNIVVGIAEFIGAFIFNDVRAILIPLGIFQVFAGIVSMHPKIPVSKVTAELKQELNKAINTQMANEYTQNNVSEEEKAIQDQMKEVQKKIHENSKTIIDQRLQDLYNFRLEHYNFKMEKLFYDVGLVNKCMENNYKWLDIDKKNIKNEGTYEDYFHYFNNYNPDNERRA